HTSGRPTGEIRGQILPRTVDFVSFTANGSQYVPPNSTSATATCTADLDTNATFLAVQCTHDVPSPTSAHIHEAPVHQNGPIVFTFPSPNSPLNANVPMTPRLVADFAATFLYLDIHSGSGSEDTANPQIRGQIGTPPIAATTGTIAITKATFPAGGSGFGFTQDVNGSGPFTLNDGQTQTFSNVTPGTYTITENDPAVSPDNYTLGDLSCNDDNGNSNTASRTATINLQAGETVICTYRNIRTLATDTLFVFHLSQDQEVPPTGSIARGGCMGRFNAGASELTLVCTHNVENPTVMHIHHGALGVNGDIAFDLGSPVSPVIATWSGMPPADVTDLMAGNLYVNIHTAGRPSGEIRGQILPRTVDFVAFPMSASQVVPPDDSPASGNCTADLDTNATFLAVQCTHNLATPDEAHVHQAPFGENGPLVYTFPSAASPFSGNVPMTPRLVADFAATFLYVDVHGAGETEETNTGEIRGQIGALPAATTTGTIRIIKETTPAGGTGFNFTDDVPGSPGTFTLNDGATHTFSNVPPGTYTIEEVLPSGYSVTDVVCGDGDSTGNPFERTATINLQSGETVTCTFRNLRTFTNPALFVFDLSGEQEVPPIPTSERGGCMAQFDSATSSLSIVCTHNVADPSVMHIHQGARGVNGPILFDLGDPRSPVEATWTGMSPSEVADLFAGNLYVNIHTGGRPTGAIRGQIVPRTVDQLRFGLSGAQEVPPTDSTASGGCFVDLSDNATSLFMQCTHNVPNPTTVHLHSAPPGVDGPVVFDLPASPSFTLSVPMSPRSVADFAAGFLYVNVHNVENPLGEIRGQIAPGFAPANGLADGPTLSEWALLLMVFTMIGAAWWRMR
ncbi:MAG TPA: IPTL-CTERM sorting domain-containing protein, partial [Thermoanaerobaculia bacterium]|nr:IPTL-CTERM sorting domain-containing protein [Thermoanaerobaculia bacterium]